MTSTTHDVQQEAADHFLARLPLAPGVIPTITPESRATRAWARTLIDRGKATGHVPRFGTPEWVQLPDADPRKVAACVAAALTWHIDGEDLPFRIAQDAHDQSAAEEAYWDEVHARRRPIVAAHLDRQRIVENRANAPVGRDHKTGYTGGPTEWTTPALREGAL